jgi:hypothetical protein
MNVKAMYDLQIIFCFLEFELNTTFKLILSQLILELGLGIRKGVMFVLFVGVMPP